VKTTLLIPTLNELAGMKAIMPRVKDGWVDEVLVIDGHSTDGTVEYARELGYRVVLQKSRGLTYAYQEALEHITGDIVISFSPDGNSIPELIPDLIKKMSEGYDMVIASRYFGGAKSEDDDAVTALGNWLFTKAINVLFGGHYTDTLVMFRAWRKSILTKESFPERLERTGIEPLLAIKCAKRGLKTADIPGPEPKRISGVRKMHPILNGIAVLRLIFRELFTED
jgi:glycosyltransferase involved in cell wall biosynthesis